MRLQDQQRAGGSTKSAGGGGGVRGKDRGQTGTALVLRVLHVYGIETFDWWKEEEHLISKSKL